jgi:FAD/FMN-containing dehydrogenase
VVSGYEIAERSGDDSSGAAALPRRFVRRGEAGFEQARVGTVWNGRTPDRFPAVIVQPESAEEVAQAVVHARESGMRVTVRSGGHSWAASFLRDDGMLLDLSRMRDLSVDTGAGTAWAQPGLSGDELNRRLERDGLFFPTGHCKSVGLGGFLLQGGFGWNSRLWGPACVSVRAIDVVTATGELVRADATHNPDLFWAARGAGPGFFGVVTRFHLTLHPRPRTTMVTTHVYPIDALPELVRWLLAIQPDVPRTVECMLFLRRGLPGLAGPGALLMAPVLADDDADAREALSFVARCPCASRALERNDEVRTTVDQLVLGSQDTYPDGERFWVDNMWTDASAEQLAPALAEIARTLPAAPSHLMMLLWGPPQPVAGMAFSMQANVYLGLYGIAHEARFDDTCREWSTGHMRRLEPLSRGIQLADENLGLRRAPFMSDENTRRLEELREQFDPDGVFHGYMGSEPTSTDAPA